MGFSQLANSMEVTKEQRADFILIEDRAGLSQSIRESTFLNNTHMKKQNLASEFLIDDQG